MSRNDNVFLSQLCVSLISLYSMYDLISRTSAVLEHSVAGTITTAQAIIIAIGKPLMAKLADVYVHLPDQMDQSDLQQVWTRRDVHRRSYLIRHWIRKLYPQNVRV